MNLNNRRIGAYLKGSGKAPDAPGEPAPAKPETPQALIKVTRATPAVAVPQRVPPKTGNGSAIRDSAGRPGKEDIAKYLVLIGKEEASNILRHLTQPEVESIAQEIAKIKHITSDEARDVLERFHGLVKTGMRTSGGLDTARSLLVNAFGEEKGGQLLRDVNVVDYYKGQQIPSGYRGLTISCFYCSDERTLTETEISPAHNLACGLLTELFGAKMR